MKSHWFYLNMLTHCGILWCHSSRGEIRSKEWIKGLCDRSYIRVNNGSGHISCLHCGVPALGQSLQEVTSKAIRQRCAASSLSHSPTQHPGGTLYGPSAMFKICLFCAKLMLNLNELACRLPRQAQVGMARTAKATCLGRKRGLAHWRRGVNWGHRGSISCNTLTEPQRPDQDLSPSVCVGSFSWQ